MAMANPFSRKKAQEKVRKQDVIDRNKHVAENSQPVASDRKEAERLINEAKKFEQSTADNNQRKARWALVFAGAFGFVAVAEAVAITVLTPLKSVEPYVIRVDNTTGYVDVVRPLAEAGDLTQDQAIAKHFVAQYVLARESHDWFMATSNYNRVKALSANRVFSAYDNFIRSDESPLEVLGRNRRAEVTITNITFVGDVAQVRFTKSIKNLDGTDDIRLPTRKWIATINYQYSDARMSDSARLLNPLNFRVTGYNVASEAGGVSE